MWRTLSTRIDYNNDALEDILEKTKNAGKEEGRKEGERKKALETGRNLKLIGLTLEQIVKATGLTLEDLKNL